MKHLILLLCISGILSACGNEQKQTSKAEATTEAQPLKENTTPDPLSNNPDYQKGLELIGQSDCLTCHKIDDISTGPSYRDIANKYESNKENISLLAGKIIKGGAGVWGPVPMTPHPDLSKKDAEQM
ncbi:MAG TPA: c-type cytochrome, partial [Chitinophagaceae bacterium]|nr:c-type cytochrome [Chitinophagaceae bacterium]